MRMFEKYSVAFTCASVVDLRDLCVQIECLNRSNELLRKSLREKWTKCALHSYAEEKWLFLVLYLN
ncbi:hypothetical protein T12_3214 [Trichinella patagoniensis]|uniref:Uncharacterized protein n=1 Tax=Trichinella patagoniensis TaxID=990121 RepID=A0A0V0ZAZ5_9BILA|nr:hypothetical protein T12_3214 [Trichinella patagoniensis]